MFDLYFEEIRKYIYYRGGDAALADDVTQQTFLKVWEKNLKVIPGNEKGLLYKIAGNEFIDQIRKRNHETDFSRFHIPDDLNVTPQDQIEYQELSDAIKKILDKMKDNQRVVFLMSRYDGLRYHEIAKRLDISVKAVEKRMSAALSFFKQELEKNE